MFIIKATSYTQSWAVAVTDNPHTAEDYAETLDALSEYARSVLDEDVPTFRATVERIEERDSSFPGPEVLSDLSYTVETIKVI